MRPIPKKLLADILADPWYKKCCRQDKDCQGRITLEHALLYRGRQINEKWAIIPLCVYHHLGKGLNKRINKDIALERSIGDYHDKYPLLWQNNS